METVPLYHGTDSRILAMSPEERQIFIQDCSLATDFLWALFEPYYHGRCKVPLDEPGMEGCTTVESKLIELKDPLQYDRDPVRYNNLENALLRIDAQKNGSALYQYDWFYLTNLLDRAIRYAESAVAFGEFGLNAYCLLDAAAMIKFSKWEPDQKTTLAIEKIKKFGEADPCPVVLVFTSYDPENLRMEDGRELPFPLESDSKIGFSLQYRGYLDIASAIRWNIKEARKKLRKFEISS